MIVHTNIIFEDSQTRFRKKKKLYLIFFFDLQVRKWKGKVSKNEVLRYRIYLASNVQKFVLHIVTEFARFCFAFRFNSVQNSRCSKPKSWWRVENFQNCVKHMFIMTCNSEHSSFWKRKTVNQFLQDFNSVLDTIYHYWIDPTKYLFLKNFLPERHLW